MGTVAVEKAGKAYKHYARRWQRLAEWVLPGGRSRHELVWVLRDVDFRVHPGEAFGIVGPNGAGKSTLLKLITGTTQCTTGRVSVTGSVAALLELGMGFHPDFTGRQNAYMSGQLLGMARAEIDALMPAIEAFADIGAYMDEPVRVYSSGMQVRLAFSVATARRPDVLIVDEALSVGDAQFQRKSFDRIREFREAGTTLLLVSHDLAAVKSLCSRSLWLHKGEVRALGDTRSVVDQYLSSVYEHSQKVERVDPVPAFAGANAAAAAADPADCRDDVLRSAVPNEIRVVPFDPGALRWGKRDIRITTSELVDRSGAPLASVMGGELVRMRIEAVSATDHDSVLMGFTVKDRTGQALFGDNNYLRHIAEPVSVRAGERLVAEFDFRMPTLPSGTYFVDTAVATGTQAQHVIEEWIESALRFESHNYQSIQGLVGIPMHDIRISVAAPETAP